MLAVTHNSTPDWGDVPTWALAGIAFLALVASVIAAAIFYRQLKVLEGEQERQADDRDRAQAETISTWIEAWSSEEGQVRVAVRNGSEQPIRQVMVLVDDHWGPNHETATLHLQVVPPKDVLRSPVLIKLPSYTLPSAAMIAPPIRLQFDDAAGRIWRRNERGHLHEFVVPPGQDRPPMFSEWGNDWGDHPSPRPVIGQKPSRPRWRIR